MLILETHAPRVIDTVVMDFDGTLSTLRCGWEQVMEPLMLEYIADAVPTAEQVAQVRDYIDRSTGIQTILQMKWLAERAAAKDPSAPADPWFYKAEYNRRLMLAVEKRREDAAAGNRQKYLVPGGEAFLRRMRAQGATLLAASGTDECDVQAEAKALGIDGYFVQIAGALPHSEDCSKEATLRRLMAEGGKNVLVVGDGPVEIQLGRQFGALTLGIASNEREPGGLEPAKLQRLKKAGAHAVVGTFSDTEGIMSWMEGRSNG